MSQVRSQSPPSAIDATYSNPGWSTQLVRLKLLLGELKLGDIGLPGVVLKTHFADLMGTEIPGPPTGGFPDGIDVIKYPSFPAEADLPRLTRLPGAIRYIPARYRRHYIDMDGSFADYLQKFSSKSRGNRRREVRRFEEFSGGNIAWREFRSPQEMVEFHQLARQISRFTYQDRLLKAGLPDNEEFIERMMQLARNDAARGYVLFHGPKPVSFIYCSANAENLVYRYIGYDPEYQTWSPGTVLLYLVLERLFQEARFRMFDFTEGEGPQKELFANRSAWCADILYCRRTPRVLALISAHSALDALSRYAALGLGQIGLRSQLKRILRRSRRPPAGTQIEEKEMARAEEAAS
jgi:Acetyltransferase (GNAT) domain